MGKRASLKLALLSQQSRLKKKQEAAHAAQVAEKGKKVSSAAVKGKAKATAHLANTSNSAVTKRRPPAIIPFKPTDTILLVGEGNFSFTRALVADPPSSLQYLPPGNITATTYDSEEECYRKYPGAQEIIQYLRGRSVEVLFEVDATKLEKHSTLKHRKYDKVMWNFPHAGELFFIAARICTLNDLVYSVGQGKALRIRTGIYYRISSCCSVSFVLLSTS